MTTPATSELRIHFPLVKLILDPHKMEDAHSMAVVGQLFRGLLRYTPSGEVVPDLAESWHESKDHLRFRFKLKAGVQFSDGSRITAKNVQMSFARMFFLGASMGADLDYIQGTRAFRLSKNLKQFGITVLSENELEFELSHPSGLFLKHLAVVDSAILPLEDFKNELNLTSAGKFSGPYRVAKAPDDQHLILEKWRKDALDSQNPPARITYWMTDKNSVQLALEGQTDSLDHDRVSVAEIHDKLTEKGWVVTPTEVAGEAFVVLNPALIPVETRKYLYSKVRTTDLMSRLSSPRLKAAHGVIPTWIPGELSELDVAEVRLAAQRSTPPTGKVTLEFGEGSPTERTIGEYLKEVWQTPEFQVDLKALSQPERLKRLFSGTAQACLGRKGLDYPDGFSMLGYFRSGYDSNYFHVQDPKIDAQLGVASATLDQKAREALYRSIQIGVLKQWTVIPLFFGSEASGLWSPKVKSVPAHPMGYHTLPMESVEMAKE